LNDNEILDRIQRLYLLYSIPEKVVSKLSIAFKVKADTRRHPEEYFEYFEDWGIVSNAEIVRDGNF